jgi:hypothetical protein
MWDCPDSQEVGLEAAILERKRNSSLVEWACAEDVTGLKHDTEAADSHTECASGRGAFCWGRSRTGRSGGPKGSAYADMSSDKVGENPTRRKPKVSWARFVRPG